MGRKFAGYENGLYPSFSFLSDKAVIIQAWKKSHEYIRRHNWYSDNLELDISCIELENLYLEISSLFSGNNWRNYKPAPLRLIPAPKPPSEKKVWKIESSKFIVPEDLSIRPLAHISIKDQTIAMMFLMCLANIFETLQGRPAEYSTQHASEIAVNYGNRLLCSWENDEKNSELKASFFWGNAETYNRYYQDYQNFVCRPEKKLKSLVDSQKERNYYVASLDLSKCYDRINRKELISKIKSKIPNDSSSRKFMSCLKKAFSWSWDDRDRCFAEMYQTSLSKGNTDWVDGIDGIPQGLVISGFLANIYLLDFDNAIQQLINSETLIKGNDFSISIVDYCRYVDDMRLILEVNSSSDFPKEEQVKKTLTGYFQKLIDIYAYGQELNSGKTSLAKVNFSENFSLIAAQLNEIRYRASGPLDEHNAWEILKLNKSIWEQTGIADIETLSFENLKIEQKPRDVKEETLERFSAYNWRKVYRTLSILLPAEDDHKSTSCFFDHPCSRTTLDYMTDDFCQKIFLRWLSDPSKIRILKISFDICPNANYLKIVLDLLCKLLTQGEKEKVYAFYVLSELYRAGAVETGFVYSDEQISKRYDIKEYRSCLQSKIQDILQTKVEIPWYLANQIALFCFIFSSKDNCLTEVLGTCDPAYRRCYEYMSSFNSSNSSFSAFDLTSLLIAYRIKKDKRIIATHAKQLNYILEEGNSPRCNQLLTFMDDKDICELHGNHIQKNILSRIEQKSDSDLPLIDIIQDVDNPFKSEVAILRLGIALCKFLKGKTAGNISQKKYYTINQLNIRSNQWNGLNNPCSSSTLCISTRKEFSGAENFLFKPEKWEGSDFCKLSQIGKILRASILGVQEYSLMRKKSLSIFGAKNIEQEQARYWGVRSSWLKRHYGLFFDRVVLGGTHVPISPWMTQLFSSLLAWPGSWCDEQFENLQFVDLENILRKRLNELKKYYGNASGTTIIPVDIDLNSFSDHNFENLNVALVQNIFPMETTLKGDYTLKDKNHSKKAHSHLSDLLQMIIKTFKTHNHITEKFKSINLIVFPELAIQWSDLITLERFADKVNSVIFCGLIFPQHPEDNDKIINAGMWIIPQRNDNHRSFIRLLQGKQHLTSQEEKWGITSYRPVQWLIRGIADGNTKWTLSASICYDATDIKLSADLRDIVDCYIVSSFNKDIGTFDTMAESLRYHMFNHTVIANNGCYGGSTIQAPYKESHDRIQVHVHGKMQATISLKTIHLCDFDVADKEKTKTPPAGYKGRKK